MDLDKKTNNFKNKYQKLSEENQMLRLSSNFGLNPKLMDDTEEEDDQDQQTTGMMKQTNDASQLIGHDN